MKKTPAERKRHVIIGNSAAAINAIRTIRRHDPEGSIIVVSAEETFAYSPVLLTYYLAGKIQREQLFLTRADFYKGLEVQLLLGRKAVGIDLEQERICLDDSRTVGYDNLLLATGSFPQKLGIDGENLPGIFSLKTLKDAELIRESSIKARDIVIIGGGLIGLQSANAFLTLGKHVSMVVGSKHVMSQNIDDECAEIIEMSLKARVDLFLQNNVIKFTQVKNRLRVHLHTGAYIDADLVIIGKGVVPNKDFLSGSGLKLNKGILVDRNMRTNIFNIYAAGDVAETPDTISGRHELMANWINACVQGETAGRNMAGKDHTAESFKQNITAFQGLIIGSLGLTKPGDTSYEQMITRNSRGYRKIIFNDRNEIVGAVLLGKIEDIGVIKGLIKKKTQVPSHIKNKLGRSSLKYGTYLLEQLQPL